VPPPLAAEYAPAALRLLCMSADADALWTIAPPARAALKDALAADDGAQLSLEFGWAVLRDVPPPSARGGPGCEGAAAAELAPASRAALLAALRGDAAPAPLLRLGADGEPTPALVPLLWRLRGDACEAHPFDAPPASDSDWADRWLACDASLEAAAAGAWWRLACRVVDAAGAPAGADADAGRAACPPSASGPRLVALLDRAQGGLLGATLSRFGVLGLYSVFVLAAGRALRGAFADLRLRIPYENLPSTARLVALVEDLRLARAEGKTALEAELFRVLVAIYRLPSVLFELTKRQA
jgi:hypothetical protein